ncbi:hypothetical protein I5V12_01655 [Stenotrophomonas maltophilia]|uniref:hypothetical protein n=1 Tax=Stenotrophomonas muris TaxID=2963283 RepID=UPI0018D2B8F4|nr:hypothetical protein [Stenotrophomonas maltophilia]
MSWIDGVSQCWALGKGCVVDWSAIAALIALLGVVVSAAAAVAVFRLGRETNRLADVARSIAQEDREREATFILVSINADVIEAASQVRSIIDRHDELVELFCLCVPTQSPVFMAISQLDLHIDAAHLARLHVLDKNDSIAIVRARTQLKLARLAFKSLAPHANDVDEKRKLYGVIHRRIQASKQDLEHLLTVVGAALRY